MKHPLVFVLYDGINNSVFHGQVLTPLLDRLNNNEYHSVVLISFEKTKDISKEKIQQIQQSHNNLSLIVLKKYPFLGRISLYPAIGQLKKVLYTIPSYDLIARGPLAGWVAHQACKKKQCRSFTVQARGLLAQEYCYTHAQEKNPIKKWIHWLRTRQFFALERSVYGNKQSVVESVSPALGEYVVKTFGTDPKQIKIAKNDIPKKLEPAYVCSWKKNIRAELHIAHDSHVYCFNGSAKPWQCPEAVITFFKEQQKRDKNSFLLILTQDRCAFKQLAQKHMIPKNSHAIVTVSHKDIYHYLSACDTGLLFREAHPVNWVSRPTKVLEYRAVGLNIIHNDTVAWLIKS